MLRKLSRTSVLAFAIAAATSVLAIPSLASGASWGVVGTTHNLDAPGLGFATHAHLGYAGWSCAASTFNVDVRNAAALAMTGASFRDCTGTGSFTGCVLTMTATKLPWTVTGVATNDIRIDGFYVDVNFETRPGESCIQDGETATWTGTLGTSPGTAIWDSAAHQITLGSVQGLRLEGGFFTSGPVTMAGTLRDTSQTLTLT